MGLFKSKADKQANKEALNKVISGEHATGLPIPEGNVCGLVFEDDHLSIGGGGNTFRVAYSKITNIAIKSDTDIQKEYVSSAGGALAGAALFGPLGAIVGGRVKEKKTTTVEHYMLITYNKDTETAFLSFRVHDWLKATKAVDKCKPLISGQSQTIDL